MNWQDLEVLINSGCGYHFLEIGWVPEFSKHASYMQFRRSLIQRVVFHENLFTVYFSWRAFLDPFTSLWIFMEPPKENPDEFAQALDADVTNTQPLVLEMPYGKTIYRVQYSMHQGLLLDTEIDPSSIDLKNGPGLPRIAKNFGYEMSHCETGKWVIPPDCGPLIQPVKFDHIKRIVSGE